jgi:cytochrome c-type biogenesis protein CcmH/NrfG
MANSAASESERWRSLHVYLMSAACLMIGLAAGYLLRGSQSASPGSPLASPSAATATSAGVGAALPILEQMKHMAEKKAEPLLAKLRSDPQNAALLIQIGDIYKQTHQFKDAADYYARSLAVDPKNAGVRSDLASCLYYTGNVDGALAQLEEGLKYDAASAPTLFNLGMVRWQGKQDARGAIEAWEQLLKTNPKLPPDRKASVEKLIADARKQLNN